VLSNLERKIILIEKKQLEHPSSSSNHGGGGGAGSHMPIAISASVSSLDGPSSLAPEKIDVINERLDALQKDTKTLKTTLKQHLTRYDQDHDLLQRALAHKADQTSL
jgi:hypothetical protein